MSYVSFIPDQHLVSCIKDLFKVYKKCHEEMSSKKFYKNRVDPMKFIFDSKFNNIVFEDYLLTEISRQHDKTISNAIGEFHEKLIGGIEGFKKLPVGAGHDIENSSKTIFAEIKNKHNTVKGEDFPTIFNKLEKIAINNPKSTCYFVRIIDKKSRNDKWSFSNKSVKYFHDRVRIISGDKFYAIATGKENAFKELCDALPLAIEEFIESNKINIQRATNTSLIDEINIEKTKNNRTVVEQIFYDNFKSYNGF